MRPSVKSRKARLIYAGAGALMLIIPATAVALTAVPDRSSSAAAKAAPSSALHVVVRQRRITYGHNVTVTGMTSTTAAGRTLWLEFAAPGATSWRAVTSSRVLSSGGFQLAAPLHESGFVRVTSAATAASADWTPPSASERVAVAATLRVPSRSIGALEGRAVDVRGNLVPAAAGRRVRLEGHRGDRWRMLTATRIGRRGGFDLHYVAAGLGQQRLRVRFAGDRRNDWARKPAGRLTVYRQSLASWYQDGGATACGFHVYYGVANKALPCGTKVSFRLGGRSVTAVIDDRGPYVGGREWDFNQNSAAALGFDGVGIVWSSR
jgi:rare lipoprotein A